MGRQGERAFGRNAKEQRGDVQAVSLTRESGSKEKQAAALRNSHKWR